MPCSGCVRTEENVNYHSSINGREMPKPFGHTKDLPKDTPRPTRSKYSPPVEDAKHVAPAPEADHVHRP